MIVIGDCREVLSTLPDQSVQCCVTSPPYFGLRDYGVSGQMGLEPTLSEYISGMVAVFREVRRVLRDDGVLFLNIGDSYAAARGGTHQPAETLAGGKNGCTASGERVNRDRYDGYNPTRDAKAQGLKHKDLMMVPARLAIALQDDGWWLRSDIVWCKPNPMPESVCDRPTSAHEHIFLMTKNATYYYDAAAIAEPTLTTSISKFTDNGIDKQRGHSRRHAGFNGRYAEKLASEGVPETRNARNVWNIATQPFSEAHFATFPPEIPRRCILAGSREGDTVLDPFNGAGTTGLVASRLNREYIGIELNPEYAEMSRKRIYNDAPLLNGVA